MPGWNKFANEVAAERARMRAYGLANLDHPQARQVLSYKAQALRELALRLELEEVVRALKAHLAAAIDRLEAAECALDIAHLHRAGPPLERAPG